MNYNISDGLIDLNHYSEGSFVREGAELVTTLLVTEFSRNPTLRRYHVPIVAMV